MELLIQDIGKQKLQLIYHEQEDESYGEDPDGGDMEERSQPEEEENNWPVTLT